jgi:hypothetical protein
MATLQKEEDEKITRLDLFSCFCRVLDVLHCILYVALLDMLALWPNLNGT